MIAIRYKITIEPEIGTIYKKIPQTTLHIYGKVYTKYNILLNL